MVETAPLHIDSVIRDLAHLAKWRNLLCIPQAVYVLQYVSKWVSVLHGFSRTWNLFMWFGVLLCCRYQTEFCGKCSLWQADEIPRLNFIVSKISYTNTMLHNKYNSPYLYINTGVFWIGHAFSIILNLYV